jgi:hypothetical protein
VIDVTAGFAGASLGPVSVTDAVRRVLAYCTTPRSGWAVYDLAGVTARRAGQFDEVGPWSLLFANALNGRVEIKEVAAFDRSLRTEFASRLAAIPACMDLHAMAEREVRAVVSACQFGFRGAGAPRMTKLGALYRPHAIPVLDGHIAEAFGFGREGFSNGTSRLGRIDRVVRAMAAWLATHRVQVSVLREQVAEVIPEVELVPDLRLVDIVLWTSWDDLMPRRRDRQGIRWSERAAGERQPLDAVEPAPVQPASYDRRVPRSDPPQAVSSRIAHFCRCCGHRQGPGWAGQRPAG